MTLREALLEAARRLEAAGIDGSAGDARALLAEAVGIARDRLTLHLGEDLEPGAAVRFAALIARRAAREPVAKILGRRVFWGREFEVTADVLDPRPETECLIAEALAGPKPLTLLDLGTGSGILAVTLLAEWPEVRGVATDLSDAALAVAARNAARAGVAARLDVIRADWFAGVTGLFDLIVSNPPYIGVDEMAGLMPEVRDHDPRLALTDEADGLAAYRAIAGGAGAHLRPGGRLMVEIGWRQGAAVADILRAAGFEAVAVLPDLEGRDRVVCGVWPVLSRGIAP
ncbi:MAG: peptide chain release factor N(5)-glutamine methyltransferase [Roseovarius sp.]|uniref:peptide chain release factor N(5)-glutamine methyltransferase n=1 Tax=Roseovarius sp. TaxID=1486281 RepID=UPI001B73A4A4|nr:peptide chain release factor N(5)-glutamine methyltransferase [Roseovarius sp.]MBQ0749523.1 peptide chain release factor N(5)-glutamine methyltransferase [Roseovarius sp.]